MERELSPGPIVFFIMNGFFYNLDIEETHDASNHNVIFNFDTYSGRLSKKDMFIWQKLYRGACMHETVSLYHSSRFIL
jgi:hypothetical protein